MNYSEKNDSVEYRLNSDGSENSKYIDVLDEDKPISGQKFTCISFISPEKILKQKDLYFFNKFLKQWDMNKSMEKFSQFMNFISYKYNTDFDAIMKDLNEFCKEEKDNLFQTTLEDEYKSYIDNNEEQLDEEFNKLNNFKTSVRGVKCRGNFPTQEEAEIRCKMLREVDPNHDVYVGPVGMWMPFHPEAYKTGRVEYLEDELNQLMHEKDKNEKHAKVEFDKRVKESKENAIAENEKKAKETGNVLTQTIDENGELVSIVNMNTTENALGKNVSVADVRKELFEGDNIVTDKNNDHGLKELMNNLNKQDKQDKED